MSNLLLDFQNFKQKRKESLSYEQRHEQCKKLFRDAFGELKKRYVPGAFDMMRENTELHQRYKDAEEKLNFVWGKYLRNECGIDELKEQWQNFICFIDEIFELKKMAKRLMI